MLLICAFGLLWGNMSYLKRIHWEDSPSLISCPLATLQRRLIPSGSNDVRRTLSNHILTGFLARYPASLLPDAWLFDRSMIPPLGPKCGLAFSPGIANGGTINTTAIKTVKAVMSSGQSRQSPIIPKITKAPSV